MTIRRHELTESKWLRLAPLLPPQKPNTDHRTIVNGILWKPATGAPWRDLPERYGPWSRVYRYCWRWQRAGLWDSVFAEVQRQEDAAGGARLGAPVCRWHRDSRPPACGGRKGGGPEAEALGRSQGGFSTKVHLRAEGHGKPMTFVFTPGQRHEATAFGPLLAQGAVKRPGRGRPRLRPERVSGDKGYSSHTIRRHLRRRGIRATIPRKANEHRTDPFDRTLYRVRRRVEGLINRCKHYRSLATRYDKRVRHYRALWTIAATILWLSG